MALHRKQRGVADAQYIRIPTSSAGYSLHEAHPRAHRVYAKRYAAGDRSRKISSLQLRVCFLLCVLLYFGAIYFADDIASIGRVVGSEQSSQNFFVHSLRPRGRGHVRVGRAVDAKRADASPAPVLTSVAPVEEHQQEQQQEQGDPPTESPELETQSPADEVAATAETEEAQATEPLEQPDSETERETRHQDEQTALDNVPGDAVHPGDQGEEVAAHQSEQPSHQEVITMDHPEDRAATPSTIRVEPSQDINHKTQGLRQQETIATPTPTKHSDMHDPQPTAALRQPEKEAIEPAVAVDPALPAAAVPAASPARSKQQHAQINADDQLRLPKQQANLDRKRGDRPAAVDGREQPSSTDGQEQQIDGQRAAVDAHHDTASGQQELTAADGQHGAVDGQQEEQLVETTQPSAQMTEHISDI